MLTRRVLDDLRQHLAALNGARVSRHDGVRAHCARPGLRDQCFDIDTASDIQAIEVVLPKASGPLRGLLVELREFIATLDGATVMEPQALASAPDWLGSRLEVLDTRPYLQAIDDALAQG